jgi:hypothetical protein
LAEWIKRTRSSWALLAHAYNPSYSGGRDQDCDSKTAWANSLRGPILKKIHHKNRAGGGTQVADLEFKPQYCKKN